MTPRLRGVYCVVMPCCGFTYDAQHTNVDGSYTCPLCETPSPSAVAELVEAARELVKVCANRQRGPSGTQILDPPERSIAMDACARVLAAIRGVEGR